MLQSVMPALQGLECVCIDIGIKLFDFLNCFKLGFCYLSAIRIGLCLLKVTLQQN